MKRCWRLLRWLNSAAWPLGVSKYTTLNNELDLSLHEKHLNKTFFVSFSRDTGARRKLRNHQTLRRAKKHVGNINKLRLGKNLGLEQTASMFHTVVPLLHWRSWYWKDGRSWKLMKETLFALLLVSTLETIGWLRPPPIPGSIRDGERNEERPWWKSFSWPLTARSSSGWWPLHQVSLPKVRSIDGSDQKIKSTFWQMKHPETCCSLKIDELFTTNDRIRHFEIISVAN